MKQDETALAYQHVAAELRLYVGADSLAALERELERGKCRRAVVVCGNTVSRGEPLRALQARLGARVVGVTATAREHSPVSGVAATAAFLAEAQADAVIAVGGGSAAVTARAAAVVLGERKPIEALCTRRLPDGRFESPRLNAPKIPQFVVPTTPSTAFVKAGSAVHDDAGQRLALFDPKTRARAIFVHPAFIATAPETLVRGAALNAFANAVEALEAPRCDPVSEASLMHALRLLRRHLPEIGTGGTGVLERLVVAAILCGRGTEQGGTGLASVLAHAIGHRSHVANGIVNAIVLPHTMRYNVPVTGDRGSAVVEAMRGGAGPADPAVAADVVEGFLRTLPVPQRLRDIGIATVDLDAIAAAAMGDWFISRNARAVDSAGTVRSLLDAAW